MGPSLFLCSRYEPVFDGEGVWLRGTEVCSRPKAAAHAVTLSVGYAAIPVIERLAAAFLFGPKRVLRCRFCLVQTGPSRVHATPAVRLCGCRSNWALVRSCALCVWSVACGQSCGVYGRSCSRRFEYHVALRPNIAADEKTSRIRLRAWCKMW